MKIFVETERLILREVMPEDVDGFFALDSDPEVVKYFKNQLMTEKGQAEKLINYVRKQYVDNGIGRWAIIEK
ncbi:MAG TPA: GNAT family N-acetyltransferase, partial [Bacteroidia bacterium]|nr:GNAT family N-acetyltransferase [Bacteroidia bacterium]